MGGRVKPQFGFSFSGNVVFFVVFFFVEHVSKKKLVRGVVGWGLANPSFSDFLNFLNLTKPLSHCNIWRIVI